MIEYGEDEISGAEELTMMTTQYKDVVQVKKAKEQSVLANVKRDILTDSMA